MRRRECLRLVPLISTVVAGVFLRVGRIRDQILGGDELHLVRAINEYSPSHLLTHFGITTDYCQPLAALYRWLSDLGMSLDEFRLRLLPLVAGVSFCLAAAAWSVRRFGWLAGTLYSFLICLHPLLIYYSRIVRPYGIVLLLLSIASVSLERLLATRSWRWLLPFALSGALSVWFHLGSAPFLAALCSVGLLLGLRERGAALSRMVAATALTAVFVASVLLPSLESLFELLKLKSGAPTPGLAQIWHSLLLLLGTPKSWIAIPILALGAWGSAQLLAKSQNLFWIVLLPICIHALSMWIFRPDQMENPLLLARYQLMFVPSLLLCVALGMAALCRLRGLGSALTIFFVAAFLATHPLLTRAYLASRLQADADWVRFYRERSIYPEEEVPEFYRELGGRYPNGTLLELPWQPTWHWNRPFLALEAIHRQPILATPLEERIYGPRFRWRNFVLFRVEAALASPARYLVIHRRLPRELAAVEGTLPNVPSLEWRQGESTLRGLRIQFERALGPPIVRDKKTFVWDLDAAR